MVETNIDKVTLIVGDMHLKQRLILPMVDKAVEKAHAERIVLCGDYMDDWGAGDAFALDALDMLVSWIDGKRASGFEIVPLVGNHDFCYINKFMGCGTQGAIIDEAKDKLDSIGLRAAIVANGHLVTHAGLTEGWRNCYMPDADDVDKASDAINEMFDNDTVWRRCLYEAGYGRGGDSPTPGPLWTDASELIEDPAVDISQIVGHTPMLHAVTEIAGYYDEETGKDNLVDLTFCDTFSLHRDLTPGGDGSMIIVDDDGIKSISNKGLWKQNVADYRIERGGKTFYDDDELDIGNWDIEELL